MPVSVSLTANMCENATNKLQIIDNQPPNGAKKMFGVCCKAMTFDDRSYVIRFVEWAAMMRILGADKITIFKNRVHLDFEKILNHFEDEKNFEVLPYRAPSNVSLASKSHSIQFQMLEMMQHTDCFYRTRNLYEYIAVMDTDEVIVPMRSEDYTWHDLAKHFDLSKGIVSFLSRNQIMPNLGKPLHADIPEYHYMLQHTEVRFPYEISRQTLTLFYQFSVRI
jgi:Glycosyltransferase family 92